MTEQRIKSDFWRRQWQRLGQWFTVGVLTLLYRINVFGKANVPKDGPLLVVCNHQSFFDPMFSHSWVWRTFYFVPRATLLDVKFWGKLIGSYCVIPIHPGQADVAAMKTIIDALKQGKAVCLYPEGTRTYDGRIAPVKPGFGLMSRRSGAAVLPMVIDGMFESWPRTQKYPKLGPRVGVMYGQPFSAEAVKEMGEEEFAKKLTETLRQMQADLRRKMGRHPFTYDTDGV